MNSEEFLQNCDPALLDPHQLHAIFGERTVDTKCVIFQHASRVTPDADFLPPAKFFKISLTARGLPIDYRKGQLHPSVWIQSLNSCLATSLIPLGATDTVLVATGGTPETVVAAIVCGYQHVVYIAGDAAEESMMTIPSTSDEREYKIDYDQYSWDPN